MSDNIYKIKQLRWVDILSKLWIKFKERWAWKIQLYDSSTWKIADWWIANEVKWIITDFSKGRWTWDKISFVKEYLWITDKEVYDWYDRNFWISNTPKKMERNLLLEKWEWLWELTETQTDYIKNRWIDVKLLPQWIIKNYWWAIAIQVKSSMWNMMSIQRRSLSSDKARRFQIEEWYSANWLFFHWINKEDNTLFLVEWMFDFLSLRQFTTNVVWLVSAQVWIKELVSISQKYDIIYIADWDEAWKNSINKIREEWVAIRVFNINYYWDEYKDINDVVSKLEDFWITWEQLINDIKENSERKLTSIELAIKEAEFYQNEMKANKWHLWLQTWMDIFDLNTWWIVRWSTFCINWPSWWGKTLLSLVILKSLLDKWKKIAYFSLEVWRWKMLSKILGFLNNEEEMTALTNMHRYDLSSIKNLELYDWNNVLNYNDLKEIVLRDKPDIMLVDYAQLIPWLPWGSEKERMDFFARDIQRFSIRTLVSTIYLSQVSKSDYKTPLEDRTPKESNALLEASDTFINVWKEWWVRKICFMKTKNASPWYWWGTKYVTEFDRLSYNMKFNDDIVVENVWKNVFTKRI